MKIINKIALLKYYEELKLIEESKIYVIDIRYDYDINYEIIYEVIYVIVYKDNTIELFKNKWIEEEVQELINKYKLNELINREK